MIYFIDRKFMFAMAILISAFGCGTKKNNESSSSALSTPASLDEITGLWQLSSVSIKEKPLESIVFSGIETLRLRKDGVAFYEQNAFSASSAGIEVEKNCTAYMSAKAALNGSTVVFSDVVIAELSTSCLSSYSKPTSYMSADTASKVYKDGGKLRFENETTVKEKGVSTKLTVVSIYEKKSEETWSGIGLDPNFIGTFKLSKTYIDNSCLDSDVGAVQSEIAFSGTLTQTISDNNITETQTDFRFGSDVGCSGSKSGTIQPEKLFFNVKPTTSTNDCMLVDEDPSEVTLFQRDIALTNSKYVSLISTNSSSTECASGTQNLTTIAIYEKQ